jgi:hypothetical protein
MIATFGLSYSGNLLFITPTGELPNNYQYKINIGAGLSGIVLPSGDVAVLTTDYEFWFTTYYCPTFTTPNRVKLQIGPLADNVIDDTLWRMIHKNSLDGIELWNMYTGANVSNTYFGCTWENVPTYLKRYVECKTAYDLLSVMRVTQQMNGTNGSQTKTLGDMTIVYGGQGGNPSIDPKRLADLYNCWNEAMRMLGNMQVTVKSIYDTSLGYGHPAMSPIQNRVIRPVSYRRGFGTPGTPYYRNV